MLNPKTKTVKAEIASMCKLPLIFRYNKPKASKVLNKAPKKKKCNSGYCSRGMLFRNNRMIKKLWNTSGILRCSKFEIIIESTFPVKRSKKYKAIGNKMVIIEICKKNVPICLML